MQKNKIGSTAIVALVVINIILWIMFTPPNDGREAYITQLIGEVMSSSSMILMSCVVFLATRARFLEPYFGGLDRMYQSHKQSAIFAAIFIFAHFFVISLGRGVNLGVSLGKIALIGLLISIILALAPRIPFVGGYIKLKYNRWRILHKFIGVFIIVGILHTFRVENLMQDSPEVHYYVRTIQFAGAAVYLYKEILAGLFSKKLPYIVEHVRRLNGVVVEVTLKPLKDRLAFKAGQFLFVDFAGDPGMGEPHPFTISSSPRDEHLKLAIKTSGDFTQQLFENLSDGTEAHIQGGYGMFTYRYGGSEQVWVAGGIGITPFLSWIRDFEPVQGNKIDLFYALRSPDEALYKDEIEDAQEKYQGFKAHFHYSHLDGRLTVEKIISKSGSVAEKDIYLCGPFGMTLSLREKFIQQGVPSGKIHYEEFNFR